MKKLRVLKLGTECRDQATGLEGTVTHWIYDMGHRVDYLFQPRGLNKFGQPLKKIFVCEQRLSTREDNFEEVDVPVEILGTTVTDKASGFTGMAVNFIRHINGCFHVMIQPKGTLRGENTPIQSAEFDLRGCVGKKITELSEEEKRASQKKTPSPTGGSFHRRGILSDHLPRRG